MQASLQRFTNSINVDSLHSVYPKRIETTPASFLLQDIYIHGGLHFRFFVGFPARRIDQIKKENSISNEQIQSF